jgi:hypothetical protein
MDATLERVLLEIGVLPEEEQRRIARILEEEVHKAKGEEQAPAGRWANLVERMQREAPMRGKSEEFLSRVREFRDHSDLRIRPAGE